MSDLCGVSAAIKGRDYGQFVDFGSVLPPSPFAVPNSGPRCDRASMKVQVIRRISGQRHGAARDW